MFNFLKRLVSRYGFGRRSVTELETLDQWYEEGFFTDDKRKAEKLASLARYMDTVKALREKAIKQKKRHSHLDDALQSAMTERLEIEAGRRVFDGTAWTLEAIK
jgi:cation diffusion facilitator CzcD-associated flavoprotein CzcO